MCGVLAKSSRLTAHGTRDRRSRQGRLKDDSEPMTQSDCRIWQPFSGCDLRPRPSISAPCPFLSPYCPVVLRLALSCCAYRPSLPRFRNAPHPQRLQERSVERDEGHWEGVLAVRRLSLLFCLSRTDGGHPRTPHMLTSKIGMSKSTLLYPGYSLRCMTCRHSV